MTQPTHSPILEFPEYKDSIFKLKLSDNHFRKLFDEYDAVEHEVSKIEAAGINVSDDYLEQLRRKRLHLKDQIYSVLLKSAA